MQVFEWFHHFKDGYTSVEGEECSRHTSSSRNVQVVVEVHNFVRSKILKLMMGRLDQRFGHDMCQQSIWQLLILKQSEHHLFVASDLNHLGRSRQEFLWKHCPWWIRGITFWPWNWTPLLQWKTSSSLWLKTACREQCKTKMSLITFFSQEGIIHHEFILQVWSINHHSYSEPLRHLCDAVCNKQPRKWHSGGWKIYCDSALAYSAQLLQYFWIKTVHAKDLWTPILPRHGPVWHSPLSPN